MPTLAEASLTPTERRVLGRLVRLLQDEFGPHLRSVWLYGSRARGEQPHDESDIDLLVVLDGALPDDDLRVIQLEHKAAKGAGSRETFLSTRIYTPERLAQRREIRSFFIQEVDRDKIVLYGEP